MRMFRGCAVMLVLASTMLHFGCAQPFRSAKSFSKAGNDYVRCIRWMDYWRAASYMEEKVRDDFLGMIEELGEIQIVDARLEGVDYRSGEGEGYTNVLLEYYRLPSATVREIRLRQKWVFQGVDLSSGGDWKIETPFPTVP